MERHVLTSENSAAFYAKKLDLDPEPPAAPEPAKPVEGEPVVESVKVEEIPPADVDDDPAPEKQSKVHLRFSELTEKAKAAQAEADKARAEVEQERKSRVLAEERANELERKLNPPKTEPDPEPKREQFINDAEYLTARDEWVVDKAFAEKAQKDAAEKVVNAWKERQTAAKAEIPDYEKVIAESSVQVSDQVRDAIIESEQGPKILHYLALNPQIGKEIQALTVGAALRRIGKLEAKFEAEPSKAPEKAVVVSEPSRAPAPITPLKGLSAPVEVPITADGEFHGTAKQWRELRKAGKIK